MLGPFWSTLDTNETAVTQSYLLTHPDSCGHVPTPLDMFWHLYAHLDTSVHVLTPLCTS